MPKDPRIKKVLVIGSGPIIIGQAAEFDYSGTQACRALKSEGVEAVRYLCAKQNPAAFRLYTRLGHTRLEDVTWYDTEFYSFEKLL